MLYGQNVLLIFVQLFSFAVLLILPVHLAVLHQFFSLEQKSRDRSQLV